MTTTSDRTNEQTHGRTDEREGHSLET